MLYHQSNMSCDSPLTIFPKYYDKNGKSDHHRSYGVPCGKCAPCLQTKVSGWRIRLMEEEKTSLNAYFITLTYDTIHVPIAESGFMTLSKDHAHKFTDNLKVIQKRNKQKPKDYPKLKYYLCGEYGSITKRPHYHLIIYNLFDPLDIPKAWKFGKIDIQLPRSEGAMAYTAGYISKPGMPHWQADSRKLQRQFSHMSMKLGIAYTQDKQNIRYHKADILNRCFITQKGIKYPMPDYYKQKIYTQNQRDRIARHAQQLATEKPEYDNTTLELANKQGRASKFNSIIKLKIRE